ncbi:integrator complex subunit [Nesidiocoris tenuis]|uniref:Integrator complex subunit n=1 Tax=Nesidiocoris tenuis TaxID=355587 RepID=A0ABN7AA03_9HEMI|nr:integrator complex subunit [Nesidiocoris tenuis]
MERGKGGSGRGGKSKTPQFPADLFALGSKNSNEGKPRPTSSHPAPKMASSSSGERDRKRDASALPSTSVVPAKKSKLPSGSSGSSHPSKGSSSSSSSSSFAPSQDSWESLALEVDPAQLSALVMEATELDDQDKVIGLLCGAVKLLRQQRSKVDNALFISLAYLSKIRKSLFTHEAVVAALSSLLRRQEPAPSTTATGTFKPLTPRANLYSSLLAVVILMRTFQDVKRWPDSLLRIYIEDAGGERSWVDHELAKNLVQNIIYSLGTKPSTVVLPEPSPRSDQPEDELIQNLRSGLSDSDTVEVTPPSNRFRWNKEMIENLVLETVKDQLTRRQSTDLINRNFLKMLNSLCGVGEVRLLVASRLENWLQNPKLVRSAQELLMSLCVNCSSHSMKDVEAISCLIKIRLKTKALSNFYLSCIKELVSAHPENLGTVLKHTIYNELSSSRNPNNLAVLPVIFQFDADRAARHLADIFLELLLNRDDYLRPLRALLRELARVLRHDLKLYPFCRGLMDHKEPLQREVDPGRSFSSTVDIISLCLFLAVMPHARSDKKDSSQIEKMQLTISAIQGEFVLWLHETGLRLFKPSASDYVHSIHKVFLLEPAEQYYKFDNWPPEQDRVLFMRMACDVPVSETALVSLLASGIKKEQPLSAVEAMDLTLEIVKRAASISNPLIHVLKVEKLTIFDLVFNLSAYRHPDNINLPPEYKPPSLAISNLYWKGWTLLLILSAHNPTNLGQLAWTKYPTLRVLMEMCITSHFVFPTGVEDLQTHVVEKQNILEFESHLAAASTKMEITEQTSLLLSQLIGMEPLGMPRRPPQVTIETIKTLNSPLKLGHLLCRSRNPDFLLDIIQHQGSSQSMPWLADLVLNSDGALNHLPVQCLCEFLLSSNHKQEGKYQQLLKHLQSILTDSKQDPALACEVLEYFLKRLSSPNNRALAITGLKLVISPINEDEVMDVDRDKGSCSVKDDPSWLTEQLPQLPHFDAARPQIVQSLRQACLVENEPELVTAYLCFLARYSGGSLSDMGDLVLDMAQLIVERSTITSSILPVQFQPNAALDAFILIFFNYLTKAREPRREKYTWSECQDQVIVQWPSGESCTVHILVIHAMVILLTYGPMSVTNVLQYQTLLDTWFPEDQAVAPKGFLVDTSEEALLIPDWLKLRMIRSHVPRLVTAALTDLDNSQLVLFIQSFGIPIASMSKLLATLDQAVLTDPEAVGKAVIDKAYMIQLVEVQHKRGAVGGSTFTSALSSKDVHKPHPPESKPFIVPKQEDATKYEKKERVQQSYMSEEESVRAIEKLFDPVNDLSIAKEQRALFTNLQRTLVHEISSKNSSFVRGITGYMMTRVVSNSSDFINAILTKPQFSCPLFRLLTTIAPNSTSLALIAQEILKHKINDPRIKSLLDILTLFLKKQEKMEVESSAPEKSCQRADDVVGSLSRTMKQLLISSAAGSGHLVDKLVKLEPEILGSEMELQMKMLFCKSEVSTLHCRPYLLTLLTHHASWRTLSNCVEILLRKDAVTQFEPTPALDFLKALTCNPKLWQGREKHTPKHYKPEDVLYLDRDQLKTLADYIVAEGVNIEEGKVADTNRDLNYQLSIRLELLYQCIVSTNIKFASDVAKHLIERGSSILTPRKEAEMCRKLLIQLYLKLPSLVSRLSESDIRNSLLKNSELSVGGCCTVDVMTHTLITALSARQNTKDWNKRAQELELCLRKMASSHPLLILRQLPLIAAVLRGRVDLDWSVFKFRSHLHLFQEVSGLLDMLQPTIFKAQYSSPLQKILDVYLELFQNYGREGGATVGNLMNQFVTFMHGYIHHNSRSAQLYFHKQAEAISDLQEEHSILKSLCVVVQNPKGDYDVVVLPGSFIPPNPMNPNMERDLCKTSMQTFKGDPNLLAYFEYCSGKKPSVLEPVFTALCSHLTAHNSSVRNLAHTLVMRYMRHQPKASADAINAYQACLESNNPDVVQTALEKLPEVIICSQEKCMGLLRSVFRLGINNNPNTATCITRTVALLNLQSAC